MRVNPIAKLQTKTFSNIHILRGALFLRSIGSILCDSIKYRQPIPELLFAPSTRIITLKQLVFMPQFKDMNLSKES